MSDRTFADVAPAFHRWQTLDQQLDELRREIEEEREVIGLIAAERNDLRAELAASHEREREANQAVRELLALVNGTPRGVVWTLWAWLKGRER